MKCNHFRQNFKHWMLTVCLRPLSLQFSHPKTDSAVQINEPWYLLSFTLSQCLPGAVLASLLPFLFLHVSMFTKCKFLDSLVIHPLVLTLLFQPQCPFSHSHSDLEYLSFTFGSPFLVLQRAQWPPLRLSSTNFKTIFGSGLVLSSIVYQNIQIKPLPICTNEFYL